MENILNISPFQMLMIFAMQIWLFIVFPVIMIKKLNYLTRILEAQYIQEGEEES